MFGEHPSVLATLERDATTNREEALIEIYKKLRPGEPPTLENSTQLIEATFFDNKRYDLASVGRYKLNKKLGWRRRLLDKVLDAPLLILLPEKLFCRQVLELMIKLLISSSKVKFSAA